MTYFLDTNVIIDLLNGNSNILANFKNAYVSATVKIPDLVYYEVLRGFEYSDPKNQKVGFEIFANHCGIVYMDKSVLEEAAKQYAYLRKNGITIDDDDILIGSFAIEKESVLVTNNTKHFKELNGVKLGSWKE